MRTYAVAAVLPAALALAAPAHAHMLLTSPARRTDEMKTGPCGIAGSTRGTNVTTFAPGEHPGHYRVAFDPDGDDDFPIPQRPDDAYATTLVDQITDKTGGHYTQSVTLPDVTCDNCTLQVIQIMTTSVPYDSFYFQCADIALVGETGGGDDDGGGGASGGCSAGGGSGPGAGAALVLLALVSRGYGWASRRRRRSSTEPRFASTD
jgi:hypothetical protein